VEFEQLMPNNGGLEALNVIGLRHLAFSVPNVSETVTLLVAAGYNFSAPVVGSSGKEYSLGQDPDGIALEIIAE
jgi:catechol-2,3-dioxygenase